MELCAKLLLLPDTPKLRGCTATRELGKFMFCARWRTPGKRDKVADGDLVSPSFSAASSPGPRP